jgi:hypothetical protein
MFLALIAGLLVALVASPVSNSAPKTYDAVRIAEYELCLTRASNSIAKSKSFMDAQVDSIVAMGACATMRPKAGS